MFKRFTLALDLTPLASGLASSLGKKKTRRWALRPRHETMFKRFTLVLPLTPLAPGPATSSGKNRGVGRWA
ncbi:MAG: hypothetical protein Tsb0017_26000 [Geothermobacteraceae bacterium]